MKKKVYFYIILFLFSLFLINCGGKKTEEAVEIEIEAELPARYAYRLPEDYDPNEEYPLLIVMHGLESDETKGTMLWDEGVFYEPNFILLSIRAPFNKRRGKGGYTWVCESESVSHNWEVRRKVSAPVCEDRVFEILEEFEKSYKIDPYQIYIWGLSAAAPMTYYIALNNPDVISGIAIGAGSMDYGLTPSSKFTDIEGMDIFMAIGRDEGPGAVKSMEHTKNLLAKAGANVKLYIHEGGHILTVRECRMIQNFFGLCDEDAPEEDVIYERKPDSNGSDEEYQEEAPEPQYQEEDESEYQEE